MRRSSFCPCIPALVAAATSLVAASVALAQPSPTAPVSPAEPPAPVPVLEPAPAAAAAPPPAPTKATAAAPAAAAAPAPAASVPARTGKHCLDEPYTRFTISHTLAGQINPLGSEQQLIASLCVPLIKTPGILFDYTHFEVGLSNYLSPSYDHQGAFIAIAPLSVLKLRAEVAGLYIWTIPTDGAGYFSFPGYNADFSEDTRPHQRAGTAGGAVVGLSATLQGAVPLPKDLKILITDTFLAEYWVVGDKDYYYNLRRDAILAQTDWAAKNSGAVLLEVPFSSNVSLRVGVTDEITFVPRSGFVNNVAAGIATLLVNRLTSVVRNFQPFVRVGVYTHHSSVNEFRQGEGNAIIGINAVYDVATIGAGAAPAEATSPSPAASPETEGPR